MLPINERNPYAQEYRQSFERWEAALYRYLTMGAEHGEAKQKRYRYAAYLYFRRVRIVAAYYDAWNEAEPYRAKAWTHPS